jgi:hypothetical protein
MRHPVGLNPLTSVLRAIGYAFGGRLHFPKDQVGAVFTTEDGRRFTVFRHVVVDPGPGQPKQPGAVFLARFHVAGMPVRLNRWFSLLPIPFFVGLPGFRSKRWMVGEAAGDSAGYYEWDSLQNAEDYRHSFATRFMLRRSVPASVSFKIYAADQAPAPPAPPRKNPDDWLTD